MYFQTFQQMKKMLGQLDRWLDKTATYAKDKPFDAAIVGGLRLAVDQFPLARQVQIACDTAKLGASRLTGKEAPNQADTETTIDELRARIASVVTYLGTLTEPDFAATATRSITQPRWEGKVMTGHDYFTEHVVPNFYFHTTHVFAILRHHGVPVGKKDFLGTLSQRLP